MIALGYDDIPDHSVLTANISGVTTLDIVGLQYQEIYDLTGIEDFASLTTLYCNLNKLTTLDLSNNTNLVTLNCSQYIVLLNSEDGENTYTFIYKLNDQLIQMDY